MQRIHAIHPNIKLIPGPADETKPLPLTQIPGLGHVFSTPMPLKSHCFSDGVPKMVRGSVNPELSLQQLPLSSALLAGSSRERTGHHDVPRQKSRH